MTDELAYFRPGRVLSFTFEVEQHVPGLFHLLVAPGVALAGFYEITVKETRAALSPTTSGTTGPWEAEVVSAARKGGQFYYDNLRDRKHIIGDRRRERHHARESMAKKHPGR